MIESEVLELKIFTGSVHVSSIADYVFTIALNQLETFESLPECGYLITKNFLEDFHGIFKLDLFWQLRQNVIEIAAVRSGV